MNEATLQHLIHIQKQLDWAYTPAYRQALELAQKQNRLIESIFGSYAQYEAIARQFQTAYNAYKMYDNPTLRSALKIANSTQALACWYDVAEHIDWEAASKENLNKDDIEEPLKSLSFANSSIPLLVNSSNLQGLKILLPFFKLPLEFGIFFLYFWYFQHC